MSSNSISTSMYNNLSTIPGFAAGMTTGAGEACFKATSGLGYGAYVPGIVCGTGGAVVGSVLGLISPFVPLLPIPADMKENGPKDPELNAPTNKTVYKDVRRSFGIW